MKKATFTVQSGDQILGHRQLLPAALGDAVAYALEHEATAFVFGPRNETFVAETAGRFAIVFRRETIAGARYEGRTVPPQAY